MSINTADKEVKYMSLAYLEAFTEDILTINHNMYNLSVTNAGSGVHVLNGSVVECRAILSINNLLSP